MSPEQDNPLTDSQEVLQITIGQGGEILVNGPDQAVEEFLTACLEEGWFLEVHHIGLCG